MRPANYVFSPETRARMSEAHTGAKNPKSRPVTLTLNDETRTFPSARLAAKHHGISQQSLQHWLSGKLNWPGQGRQPRGSGAKVVGMTGFYADLMADV